MRLLKNGLEDHFRTVPKSIWLKVKQALFTEKKMFRTFKLIQVCEKDRFSSFEVYVVLNDVFIFLLHSWSQSPHQDGNQCKPKTFHRTDGGNQRKTCGQQPAQLSTKVSKIKKAGHVYPQDRVVNI